MAEPRNVVVHCESAEGKLTALATELLGCGRKLADQLGEELNALLIGSEICNLAEQVIPFGADGVYVIDKPLFRENQAEPCLMAMEKVAKQVNPRILLLGHTPLGCDLAPRLAFRLGTTAITDCVDLSIETHSKRLVQTRPVYGGNALATFTSDFDPQITTVRAKAMSAMDPDASRRGEVIPVDVDIDPGSIRTRLIEKVTEEVEGLKLEDATVIICGGRGMGGTEGFKELEELSRILKGAVGGTRAATDNGWLPAGSQIGITGKIVAPDLYIGVGLSGSSQHLSGCSGAKNIVAINKDLEANIFNFARFGVVGDWRQVLPAFKNTLLYLNQVNAS